MKLVYVKKEEEQKDIDNHPKADNLLTLAIVLLLLPIVVGLIGNIVIKVYETSLS